MITVIKEPNAKTHAGFNPVWYMLDSSNKNQDQFRYVYDIYSGVGYSNYIQRYFRSPRPEDGYGVLDFQPFISTHLNYHLSANTIGYAPASGHAFTYRMTFGETTPYWQFEDNYFDGGLVGFSGIAAHGLSVGEKVVIQQDEGYINESYQGEATVSSIISDYIFMTNKQWGENTPPNAGRAYRLNGAPFITTGLTNSSELIALNVALKRDEFIANDPLAAYKSASKFMTNCPAIMRMQRDNVATVASYKSVANNQYMVIKTYDANSNLLGHYEFGNLYSGNTTDEAKVLHFGIGVSNLLSATTSLYSVVAGSSPIITSNVSYYTYFMRNSSGTVNSEVKRINIECTHSNRTNFQLLFLDRFGSFMPINFSKLSTKTTDVDRKVYTKSILPFTSNESTYFNDADRGVTVYNTDIRDAYTVSTDFLTDEEARYVMELIKSPEVYLVSGGVLHPIIIDSGNYINQDNTDNPVEYEISFQYAYNQAIQHF